MAAAGASSDDERRVRSELTQWTVNGGRVATVRSTDRITCLAVSNAMEGVNVNVVVGGLESGGIQIWSAWDLSPVRKILESSVSPIVSIAIGSEDSLLLASNRNGEVFAWGRKQERERRRILAGGLSAGAIQAVVIP